ncbi:MAG: sulfurtransferase TusA family protein [Devosiaceae bacterium]|nr:sulfurtransferase TusA family protein [Devosiaceae bacterium]
MDIIETCGYKCPIPVLKLEKYLANKTKPIEVKLLADDGLAIIDIPLFCNKNGYVCQVIKQQENVVFLIKSQ